MTVDHLQDESKPPARALLAPCPKADQFSEKKKQLMARKGTENYSCTNSPSLASYIGHPIPPPQETKKGLYSTYT